MPDNSCFADTAARLAGIIGWLLHWSPDQFWACTPMELGTVLSAVTGELTDFAPPPDPRTLAQLRERFPDGG
ncbi:MAG: phage tail assembly chaperone [Sphingobium sp.]